MKLKDVTFNPTGPFHAKPPGYAALVELQNLGRVSDRAISRSVFNTSAEALAFIERQSNPKNYEIMQWTNKQKQKQFSVIIRKKSGRKSELS